jgi:hypothetical protein
MSIRGVAYHGGVVTVAGAIRGFSGRGVVMAGVG